MSGRATRSAGQAGKVTRSTANVPKPTQGVRKTSAKPAVSDDAGQIASAAPRRDQRDSYRAKDHSSSSESADAIVVEQPTYAVSPGSYSGTTARTSMNSNQAQRTTKTNLLIDNLDQLDDAAVRMVDRLTPTGGTPEALEKVARNFQDDSRTVGKKLRDRRRKFHDARAVYSSEPSESYIKVTRAVAASLAITEGEAPESGPWRPDDIFFRANLAIAAEDIQKQYARDGMYELHYEKLERDFPEHFLHSVVASEENQEACGVSALLKDTFDIALAIRVQCAVEFLIAHQGSSELDSEKILRMIFYEKAILRGWGVPGLDSGNLHPPQTKRIIEALNQIQSDIDRINEARKRGKNLGIEDLKRNYPTDEFVGRYLMWIRARSAEIDARLSASGKVEGVQEALEEYLEARSRNKRTVAQRSGLERQRKESYDRDAELSPTRRAALADELDRLSPSGRGKAWKNVFPLERSATTTSPLTRPSRSSHLQQSINASSGGELSSDLADPNGTAAGLPQSQISSMVSRVRQDQDEGNKENTGPVDQESATRLSAGKHFVDPQISAERVAFETQLNNPEETLFSELDDEHLEEPSQDAGFERDHRVTSNKRSARTTHEQSGVKRVRMATNEQTQSSGSSYHTPEPSSRDYNYAEVNQSAKYRTSTLNSQKPPQTRKPWTQTETNRLIEYIESMGTSWSAIKQDDEETEKVFADRDQGALKDKARNLLFDYSKSGKQWPRNFDRIKMNTSQKRQLTSMGIAVYVESRREE